MAHQESNAELQKRPEATEEAHTAAEEPGVQADGSRDLTTTEPLSSKKLDKNFCDLCQEDYYKKARYGDNRKRYFVAHLVKAHNYIHLRRYSVFAQCPVCKIEKGRWSFVVRDGDNYKFSDECSTCQRNRRSGAWMASQWKNFMDHQESSPELRQSPEATSDTSAASEEPAASEAPLLPQQ